jgi:FMN phosphatase YigB (HAD superfamily)
MIFGKLISLLCVLLWSNSMGGDLKMSIGHDTKLPKHIFFDVGHVLVKPSLAYVIWQLGPKKIAKYFWKYKKMISREFLQKRLFDYINHCSGLPTHNSIISCGQPIPQIVYDWVIGKIDSQTLLNYIHQDRPEQKTFFDSEIEQDLVFAAANLFKSKIHVGVQREIGSMVCFFKECARAYPGRVYILSNWDKSCSLLKTEFADIFNTIADDHIVFSAQVGCAKPDSEIFEYISDHFNLEKSQCILIDDLPENITGITKWGGHGILYSDVYQTQKELEKLLASDK